MKLGFACGIFDLFHAGHVLMLEECKSNCDYLIIGLNSGSQIDYTINPGKNKPIYSLQHRKLILESCKYVDQVIVYHTEAELELILKSNTIQVRFLGEDYKGKPITGGDYTPEIYYTNRGHGLSTSYYRNLILSNLNEE